MVGQFNLTFTPFINLTQTYMYDHYSTYPLQTTTASKSWGGSSSFRCKSFTTTCHLPPVTSTRRTCMTRLLNYSEKITWIYMYMYLHVKVRDRILVNINVAKHLNLDEVSNLEVVGILI